MKEYLDLFLTFARIGGFTFGGGYAMLPMLQKEVVEKKHWATEEELMDYFAIGQCTPGVIAVNTATFIGYKYKGLLGGIVATLGCVFPSLVIITIIAACLQFYAQIPAVAHALAGIRAGVCALVLDAVIKLGKKSLIDKVTIGIAIVVLCLTLFSNVPTAFLVVFAALAGIVAKSIKKGE